MFNERLTSMLCAARTLGFRLKNSPHLVSLLLFLFGMALLWSGLDSAADAQTRMIRYNDARVAMAVNAILLYLEGSFGALIMVCAGIGSIMSAAFGQYRAAISLLVVAVGSFVLRSFMGTFLNDESIRP